MSFPIRVFDQSLNLLAELDNYQTCDYFKTSNDCKQSTLVINENIPFAAACLVKDNFVIFGGDVTKAGVIDDVTLVEQAGGLGGQVLTVLISEAKAIFNRRDVIPASGQAFYALGTSGSPIPAETLMKTMVSDHCGPTAGDPLRKFSLLSIVANLARGNLNYTSCRYKNLLVELKAQALATNMGFGISFDLVNKLFVFDVIPGTDRSYGNAGSLPPVVFSIDTDTAQMVTLKNTNAAYANLAYVGGTGSGSYRTIVTRALAGAAVPSDLARREMFVNASQLSATADLQAAGDVALTKASFTRFIDVQALPASQLVYGTHYFVGDLVSVLILGTYYTCKITQVEETYEKGSYTLTLTFDKASPELPDLLVGQIQQLQGDQTNAQ